MRSRRALARTLEAVDDFPEPSVELEQYLTSPEIAAHLAHLAHLQGDLADATVVDLGTGTGMLAIATAFAEPARVVGVDVDGDALAHARENERRVCERERRPDSDRPPIAWVQADVERIPLSLANATVVSNPPFGAQRNHRHADRRFLETARRIGVVSYTIHNEGSRSFVESFAADEGGTVTHAFRATLPIDRRFSFHDSSTETVDAEVFRIEWASG